MAGERITRAQLLKTTIEGVKKIGAYGGLAIAAYSGFDAGKNVAQIINYRPKLFPTDITSSPADAVHAAQQLPKDTVGIYTGLTIRKLSRRNWTARRRDEQIKAEAEFWAGPYSGIEIDPDMFYEIHRGMRNAEEWVMQKFSWKTKPSLSYVDWEIKTVKENGKLVPKAYIYPDFFMAFTSQQDEESGKDHDRIIVSKKRLNSFKSIKQADSALLHSFGENVGKYTPIVASLTLKQVYEGAMVHEWIHYLAKCGAQDLTPLAQESSDLRNKDPLKYWLTPQELEALYYQGLFYLEKYGYNPLGELETYLTNQTNTTSLQQDTEK